MGAGKGQAPFLSRTVEYGGYCFIKCDAAILDQGNRAKPILGTLPRYEGLTPFHNLSGSSEVDPPQVDDG